MKDIILNHIIDEFGEKSTTENRISHYSYCEYPGEECSCRDLNQIEYDTGLITGGYMDSFSMVSVLTFLEETFSVSIPDKDATPDNFNTVNKMTELVKKYKLK